MITIHGHNWAVEMLQQHIARDTVRHAYLFTGPPSIGKRTLALWFAQALNCTDSDNPGTPCGQCRICRHTEQMQHTDLSIVQAEVEGGTLKVGQIRDLQHILSLSPYESKRRVAVLLRFQEANANAQNALLKTLEEAPEKVVLIITADSAEVLLPTISSRCEVLRLRPLKLQDEINILQNKYGLEPTQAVRLAHLSGGRLGHALKLNQSAEQLEVRAQWVDDLVALLQSSRRERINYADKFKKQDQRSEARQVLQTWLLFWRDLLLQKSNSGLPLINTDWENELEGFAATCSVPQIQQSIKQLEDALFKLDTTNTNARLLIEVLMLDWPLVY